jgi:hypothetical protein
METKTDFDKFLEESQEVKDYLKSFDKKRLDLHEVNLMRIAFDAAIPKPIHGMWWCDHCKKNVPGDQVTFQEFHEECGYKVR